MHWYHQHHQLANLQECGFFWLATHHFQICWKEHKNLTSETYKNDKENDYKRGCGLLHALYHPRSVYLPMQATHQFFFHVHSKN